MIGERGYVEADLLANGREGDIFLALVSRIWIFVGRTGGDRMMVEVGAKKRRKGLWEVGRW